MPLRSALFALKSSSDWWLGYPSLTTVAPQLAMQIALPSLKSIRLELAVVLACLVTLGTFGWHGFAGERGISYLADLETKHASLEVKLKKLAKDREEIDKKLKLLRPESVDPDLVDELVRAQLGLVKPNDLVMLTKSGE
jgi:cell division protein FtsB